MAAARGIRYLPVFRSRVAARLRIRAAGASCWPTPREPPMSGLKMRAFLLGCRPCHLAGRIDALILKFVATSAPQLALFNSLFSENAK